jgi:hypothetical protein
LDIYSEKSHDEESISAKLRELRNKETKLKKLEETFKIREKSLTEQRKSRIEMIVEQTVVMIVRCCFIVPFEHIVSSRAHFSHFFITIGTNLICCLTSTVPHIIKPELATGIPLYYKQRSSRNVAKPFRRTQRQTKAYRTPIVQDRENYGPAIKDNNDRVT